MSMRRLLPRCTAMLVGAGQQASLSSSKCSPNATTTTTKLSTQSFSIPTWMKNEPHTTSSNKKSSMPIFSQPPRNPTSSAATRAAFLLNNSTGFSATHLLSSFRHMGGFRDGNEIATTGVTRQCQRTQERLDDWRKEYNAALPADGKPTPEATRVFNQIFVPGSEDRPQCKRCNKFIAEHPTQQQTQCQLTRNELFALRDGCGYGEAFRGDRFVAFFRAGTEEDPKCRCGRYIGDHQTRHSVTAAPSLEHEAVELFVTSLAKKDFDGALKFFNEWMSKLWNVDNSSFCNPHKLDKSWAEEKWRENIVEGREQLTGLKEGAPPRAQRVLGLHAGTGTGKTHALLDAGKRLNATTDIYITYRLDPKELSFDKEWECEAVLLRVLMRYFGKSNRTCGAALTEHKQLLAHVHEHHLVDFLVWYFCRISKKEGAKAAPHLVVTVDDFRWLVKSSGDGTTVHRVASALGKLAFGIETNKNNVNMKCTVILSALTEGTFETNSGRAVVEALTLPSPSEDTRDFITQQMFPEANEGNKAMIAACAGTHLFSIVFACAEVKKNPTLDVCGLKEKIRRRLNVYLSRDERKAIEGYVQDCVSCGKEKAIAKHSEAKIYTDNSGSIPPTVVRFAFEDADRMYPVVSQLFATCASIDQPKQLEHIGHHYDRFRERYDLPVVPYDMAVHNTSKIVSADWFKELTFPRSVASDSNRDENSLFSERDCTLTEHKLELGKYLLPKAANHPYVDRACLTEHPDDTTCLVLYKDKIHDGMQAAVEGLNAAGDVLSKETGVKAVLCIVQAIGASVDTSSESKFRHPYVLIRDEDVEKFYTPAFAPALAFVRQRHTLEKRE